MGTDGFRLASIPGRIRIGLPADAVPYVQTALLRLRQIPSVRSALAAEDGRAVELEYDATTLSADQFLNDVARNLGVHLDPGQIASAAAESATTPAAPMPAMASQPKPVPAPAQHHDPIPIQRGSSLGDGWTVHSLVPGRMRLHHPMLAGSPRFRAAIERLLTNLRGLNAFSISSSTGTVLIESVPTVVGAHRIITELRTAGGKASAEVATDHVAEAAVQVTTRRLTVSSIAMALSLGSFLFPALRPLATGLTAIAGSHILFSAGRALLVERRLRVDVLDATVIAVALAFRRLFAASFMVWVVDVSETMLAASSRAQRRDLSELFGRQARRTWRLEDGTEVDRPVTALQAGDVIVVHAGEQIPVDGEIVAGEASIDRSALTGEHAAVECLPGEQVFAMSMVLAGTLQVIVQRTGAETTAARMVQIVEHSLEHKPRLQSLTERFADGMVAPTFGLGGAAYAIAGSGPMLAVINADFGTGIRIAGPLAMLASLSAAARNGILIKKGQVLEDLGRANAVVFDKTGTLTEDIPTLNRVLLLENEYDQNRLLACVAAAERRFSHPIARAILQAAERRNLAVPEREDAGYQVGLGVQVHVGGKPFAIGSMRFMSQNDVAIPADATDFVQGVHHVGGTAIFVASGNRLLGVMELVARARPEAAALVRYLRDTKGIDEIHLLSGDHDMPVAMLARQVGIDRYRSAMLPQQKAEYVRDLQARGFRVAMFGDGVNDTAGLVQADYSISLRGASDVATDVADVVFLDGDLTKFPLLDTISGNLSRNVKRSFALAIAPNSICMAGAMMGVFGLGASLVFNNVGNLLTIINGARAQSGLDTHHALAKHVAAK